MSLSIGIVGLPNVGKSTLFNALLRRQAALAANYPFATIEPNVGIVDVPDERLEILAEVARNDFGDRVGDRKVPEKIIPTTIKFIDIAGLVKGAHKGEGLGNAFLSHIREVDAIVHLVRDFHDENVAKAGSIDVDSDVETINTELVLSDLQVVEKIIFKLEKEVKTLKDKKLIQTLGLYRRIKDKLNSGVPGFGMNLSAEEVSLVKDSGLITLKPVIYVLNVDEQDLSRPSTQTYTNVSSTAIKLCAKIEQEISTMNTEDSKLFMKEYDIKMSGLDRVVRKSYEVLGLESFFTMIGIKEIRAWAVIKGTLAPQAAGKVHTDFERGFISAEVIKFEILNQEKSVIKAKDKGLVKLEGKNYVVRDGDVIKFNFSV